MTLLMTTPWIMRMADMSWKHGDRVRHREWGTTGTVRDNKYEPDEVAETGTEGFQSVRWDGCAVEDDLRPGVVEKLDRADG